jgi:predicted dehydrogenase
MDLVAFSNARLRIAVVGAGRIGRRHIELIGASDTSEIAAIVDPAPESESLARANDWPWHSDLGSLLAGPPVDGIVIATPNEMHVSQALACIGRGIPVLIEKPIATTVEAALSIADAANDAGVPILVGHHRRHSPVLQRAREIVRGGRLGRLVGVVGTALFYKPDDYFSAAPWRRHPGGGPILINLIHAIDDLRFVCDEIDYVQAIASNSQRGFAVEDTVAVSLRFRAGALGSFLLSDAASSPWSWEQTSGEDAMFATYPDQDCYRVAGTLGSLEVPTLRIWTSPASPSWQRQLQPSSAAISGGGDPMKRQLDHFEAVIRGQVEPLVSAADASETLRLTLLIADDAARRGSASRNRSRSDSRS